MSNSLRSHESQHARSHCPSITNSRSSLRLMSIESVMPSSHLILCHPLLLLSPLPHSTRGFSNESTLRMRWPKYWSFSFSLSPSNEHWDWSPLEWIGWISLQSKRPSGVFSNTTVQKHQFFGHNIYGQCFFHSVILLPLVAMDDWLFMVSPLIVSRKTQYSPCKSFVLLKFGGWYTKWNSACIQMLISFPFSFAFRFSSLQSYL